MSMFDSDALFSEAVQRLREAAHQDRAFDAAKMQLINLPEIIKNAGPHWPLVKNKIRIGSLGFLKGCLSDDDIIIPAGDGFLIIFAEGETEILKQRAEEMRLLLLEFYIGDEALKRLKIKINHQRVQADQLHLLLTPSPLAEEPSGPNCLFAPIWAAQANLIGSYLCLPVHHDAGAARYGYDENYAASGETARRDYDALDIDLLNAVDVAFDQYGPQDMRPGFGVTVHASTLASRSKRLDYLKRLAKIRREKLKHLFVRVAEIDIGTPMINIADWVGMLRASVRMVQTEFHYSQPPPALLSEVAVFGAGFQAPQSFNREQIDVRAANNLFLHWGSTLGRQDKAFFVDNLRRSDLIKAAAQAGAGFITSDLLWPYLEKPGGVYSAPQPSRPRGAAA